MDIFGVVSELRKRWMDQSTAIFFIQFKGSKDIQLGEMLKI